MKTILYSVALLLMCINAQAQKFYLKPYVGYGIGMPGTQETEFESTLISSTERTKIIELAGGIRAGLAAGYFFTDNMGIELNFNYQNNLGQSLQSSSTSLEFINNFPVLSTSASTIEYNSYSYCIAPLLHFRASDPFIKPYMSVGPNLLIAGLRNTITESNNNGAFETVESTVIEFDPAISLGVLGNLGVEIPLSKRIILSTGIQYQLGFYTPESATVTERRVNGINLLPFLPTSSKQFEFVDEISVLNNQPDNQNAPNQELKNRLDYSALSLVIGVVIPL